MSATGGFDYGTLDALDISPTESAASGISLFTDSGYSSATFVSSWNRYDLDFGTTRSRDLSRDKINDFFPQLSSEKFVRKHSACSKYPTIFPQMDEVTQVNTMTTSSNIIASHSASRCNVQKQSQQLSPHWSDAQGLVNSFSEVLNEHLQHSRASLKQMAPSTITRELLSLSSSSITSIGFGVLAGLLEGRPPTAIIPLFSFTHVAYALAIAVDHDSSKVHTQEWFQASLSLLDSLASERQRQSYTQVVRVIWQPRASSASMSLSSAALFNAGALDEDSIIQACRHFLDSEFLLIGNEL
jgi:hypothetical protein